MKAVVEHEACKQNHRMNYFIMNVGVSCLLLLACRESRGAEIDVPFPQLVTDAEVGFMGTVVSQAVREGSTGKMLFTDVTFGEIETVIGIPSKEQQQDSRITLAFAGGEKDGRCIHVSDVPRLETGQRYFVFIGDGNMRVANPVVGGRKGLFRLVQDDKSSNWYLLTLDGRAIVGFNQAGEPVPGPPTKFVRNGKVVPADTALSEDRFTVAPRVSAGSPAPDATAKASDIMKQSKSAESDTALDVSEFVAHVKGMRSSQEN